MAVKSLCKKSLLLLLTLGVYLIASDPTLETDIWEPTHLVWNFSLVQGCDVGPPLHPKDYFRNEPEFDPHKYDDIKRGDIVWIQAPFLSDFFHQVLPTIEVPFVLVVSEGDNSFPEDCLTSNELEALLANKQVIHLFAQNCCYQGPSTKVSRIPIGVDFHTVAYKNDLGGWGMMGTPLEQEALLLDHCEKAPPTSKRLLRAFIDFQHSDTMHASFNRYLQFKEDRLSIFQRVIASGVVDYSHWMSRKELWEVKRQYAFSISPHGNGLDCHRTWEDLSLGCIVIVKSSPLDPLYEGLPVVIIQDWDEIHEANFQKWIDQYGDVSRNGVYRQRLSHTYWMEKIKKMAEPYRQ